MPQITVIPAYINAPKPGKRYASIKSNDGVYYSFDPAKIPLNTFQKGVAIDIEYTATDSNGNTYYNIQRVRGDAPAQASGGSGASRAADPNAMSKADWAAKDAMITRSAIAKSCIEANVTDVAVAEYWLSWVLQTGKFAAGKEGPLGDEPPPYDPDARNEMNDTIPW